MTELFGLVVVIFPRLIVFADDGDDITSVEDEDGFAGGVPTTVADDVGGNNKLASCVDDDGPGIGSNRGCNSGSIVPSQNPSLENDDRFEWSGNLSWLAAIGTWTPVH